MIAAELEVPGVSGQYGGESVVAGVGEQFLQLAPVPSQPVGPVLVLVRQLHPAKSALL